MMRDSHCPDPEKLAAFVDGTVEEGDRESILTHLERCEACAFVVTGTLAFCVEQEQMERRAWRRTVLRTWARRAAVVAAATSLMIVGYLAGGRGQPGPPLDSSATVVEALGDHRPFRPRLTRFRYSTHIADRRQSRRPVELARDLRRAAPAFAGVEDLLSDPSAETLHDVARVHLSLGNRSDGLAALEMARGESELAGPPETRARVLSDLAAALLGGWEEADDPLAPVMALEAADKALSLHPRLPEALFNRALALEALTLRRGAEDAWRAYLEVDRDSGWAEEARESLASLAVAPGPDWGSDREALLEAAASGDPELVSLLVERHRQRSRLLVQDELLGEWGERFPGGEWREPLAAAKAITTALTDQTGDLLLHRTIEHIEDSILTGSGIATLARGHAAYGRGRVAFEGWRITEAATPLGAARRDLEAAESPFAPWARFWLVGCAYHRGQGVDALATDLSAIEAEARALDGLALAGRALWLHGLAEVVGGNLTAGVLAYREAGDAFSRLGEVDYSAFLRHLLAEATMFLGDEPSSWAGWLESLERAPAMADRRKAASIHYMAAVAALAGDAPSAALALVGEILADPGLADPITRAETRLLQARIFQELGDTAAATSAMAAARPLVAGISEPTISFRLDAKLAIAEAVLPLGMQADDTVARLSRAIADLQANGTTLHLPELYLARARARMALDRIQGAQDDAVAAFEMLREQAPRDSAAFWLAHFEPEEMVRELVTASLDHGDAEAAFRIAEAARSFHPEVPLPFASESPLEITPKLVRSLLTPDEVFVFFASHGDTVTAWVLTAGGERLVTLERPRPEIQHAAARLVEDLSHERWDAGSQRLAEGLYDDLLRPIAEVAPEAGRWILSASEPLSRVPFPVLLERSTGRFVVERLEVVSVPSAGFLVRARAGRPPAAEPHAGEPRSILAIGNPTHDERLFPRLGALPGAEAEARHVAAFYPESDLLTGPRATETIFKRRAAHFDVIHVAAHAMGNRPGMLRSSVLLAADRIAGDGGTLFAEEIALLALPRARAVVLSGCATARGEAGRGDQGSLARAFLAAGARATIASLWDVDDASTVALSVELHRRLASGTPPSRALREAQLALLSSDHRDSPWVWSAFQISGV